MAARDRRVRGLVAVLLAGVATLGGGLWESPRARAAADDGQAPTAAGGDSSFRSQAVAVDQPVTLPAGPPESPRNSAADVAPLPGAGTGWLGMTADDGLVTGRVSVVDVSADGPAAKAGIRPQDVLLELDGKPLRNEEDLAAALAAIAPGQRVNAAIGRENRIDEVVLTAGARPSDPRSRPSPAAVAASQPPVGNAAVPSAMNAPPVLSSVPAPPPPLAAGRSVLVPSESAPAGVVPVAGEERASVLVPSLATAPPAAPPAALTAPAWAAAPAPAAIPAPPSPVVAAPPAVPRAAIPPAIVSVPSPAAVSAWGGTPSAPPAASSRLPEPARSPVPGGPPAPVAPAFSPAAVRGAPAATPGRLALGVRTVPVDGAVQSRFRLADPGGALVIGVVHDLPASRAGVPPGSVIVALNNVPVRSPQELTQAVGGGTPGVPVPIQYVLPGGESRRAEVVLVPLEASLERALAGPAVAADPAVGPSAAGPTPALARRTVAAPPPMQSPPQQVVVPASGAIEPTPMAPLDRLEALLRRVNERLDTLESRLDRIERRGR